MRIAVVSKLWEETSPFSNGGTGAVVGILTEELVRRGHEVTLFATGDSKTSAKLVSVKKSPWNKDYSEPIEYLNIAQAFSQRNKFDVIDCHVEQKACFFAGITETPCLINISYGEFSNDELNILKKYKNLNFLSVSRELQSLLPFLNWIGNIHHGINSDLFTFNDRPGDYFLFLGRVSPQKGPHIAIEIAKKLNTKLILAGKMVDSDRDYLEKYILPEIDGVNIVYHGVADFKEKIELLGGAQALLHPIQYFEAFGLTLIESMVCGTPVVSFDNGAPKEIVENGKTGFVVKNTEEMISALKKIPEINRRDCRLLVEEKFSAKKMVDSYEKVFHSLTQ